MAVLGSDDIQLEITPQKGSYADYELEITYGGKPLFNPELLKKNRVCFSADKEDTLIPTLEKVLQENSAVVWESLEPDVLIKIFPCPNVYSTEAQRFELEVFIDTVWFYALKNEDEGVYRDKGPGVILDVERYELEDFVSALRYERASINQDKR